MFSFLLGGPSKPTGGSYQYIQPQCTSAPPNMATSAYYNARLDPPIDLKPNSDSEDDNNSDDDSVPGSNYSLHNIWAFGQPQSQSQSQSQAQQVQVKAREMQQSFVRPKQPLRNTVLRNRAQQPRGNGAAEVHRSAVNQVFLDEALVDEPRVPLKRKASVHDMYSHNASTSPNTNKRRKYQFASYIDYRTSDPNTQHPTEVDGPRGPTAHSTNKTLFNVAGRALRSFGAWTGRGGVVAVGVAEKGVSLGFGGEDTCFV
ncbi:hypothetical protein B0J11DRAFT_585641 [Dendryphion nanum]|uniref:Uncharacterized protein n=1 Tax=Dendryphion nanum TaxID=256645 RepID=A0A9P9D3S2_9PLEO|nr:hypothetical protein B0J11DRAFT_585641 [Dendryphion nanum]